jgi:hypothetical protein
VPQPATSTTPPPASSLLREMVIDPPGVRTRGGVDR